MRVTVSLEGSGERKRERGREEEERGWHLQEDLAGIDCCPGSPHQGWTLTGRNYLTMPHAKDWVLDAFSFLLHQRLHLLDVV